MPAKKGTTVSAPVPSVPSVPSATVGRGRKPTAAPVVPAGGASGRGRGGGRGAGRGAGAAGNSSAGSKKRLIASSWTDALALDLTSDTEENPGRDLMRPRSRKTSAFTTLTSIDDEPSSTEPTSHQLVLTTGGSSTGDGSDRGAHARTPARPQQQQQPLTVPRTNTVAPVAAHTHTHSQLNNSSIHQQAAQSEPEEEPFVPRFFKRKFGARPAPVVAAHPAAAWHDEEEEADV